MVSIANLYRSPNAGLLTDDTGTARLGPEGKHDMYTHTVSTTIPAPPRPTLL